MRRGEGLEDGASGGKTQVTWGKQSWNYVKPQEEKIYQKRNTESGGEIEVLRK